MEKVGGRKRSKGMGVYSTQGVGGRRLAGNKRRNLRRDL